MKNTSVLQKVFYYSVRPITLVKRVRYYFYEKTHPNEPWISQGAIQFLDQHLKKNMKGLEWGSGRSTIWFSQRLKHLTSVEYDQNWYEVVREKIHAKSINNIELEYVPLSHSKEEPTYEDYQELPAYVKIIERFADESLHFILIDGHYRQACVKNSLSKIASGGFLVIDNSNRMKLEEWKVPGHFKVVHQSENIMTQTTIWKRD